MVFEHLFPDALLERKGWTAFFLAVIYSTISIIISRLLFPANSGIVSVVFVSIFLLPYFSTLLKREEQQERRGKKSLSFLRLLRGNAGMIETYAYLFLGIYLTFMVYSFIAPTFGFDPGSVFREQLGLENVRGGAFSTRGFFAILLNNWWVLLACFLIALVAGDGAVFFVAWNASTWGTIFGYRAIEAGTLNPFVALGAILLITLPHVLLEGGAYILAAIAGGVISDEIVEKSERVQEFVVYFVCAVFAFILLYAMLRFVIDNSVVRGVLGIVAALGILSIMRWIFQDKRERDLFTYNLYLFFFAVGVFVVAAIVETIVLSNSGLLMRAYG